MEKVRKHAQNAPPHRAGVTVLAVVGLTAAGLVLGSRLLYRASYERRVRLPEPIQAKMDLLPDENAREGTPNAVDMEDTTGENFQVVLNQLLTMETGTSPCNIMAENPASNPYDLRVSLYLKETGELIGATHRIERGKRVDEVELYQKLTAGEYPLLARLELFDDDQNAAGELAVELSLLVRG